MTGCSDAISSIEEIIEDARNGRMFILVDHEDRENEGDLVIPAQMCTPAAINFMATYGRGLICLALTAERVDQLGLAPMSPKNASRLASAFTLSIEAREGIATGISAADRARTVSVATDPARGAADIATPGHIFPLRARDGGVLVRAGHTEAAVDISRLAGLNPSGVICEVMNDDGTMARLPDLIRFGQKHGLKIGTISDLIAWRRRHDNLIHEKQVRPVHSAHGGDWLMRIFADEINGDEHVVLTKGDLTTPEPVLVRVHMLNPLEDLLGIGGADELPSAMRLIAAEGRGAVVLMRDTSVKMVGEGEHALETLREYGLGAQILAAIGLSRITLITNSQAPKIVGLEAYGLSILGTRPTTE
ncbi:3,4-dihydroxy-2-butanone-4-phosphate synthase [Pseudogemmobacter humi]|uniref:3,4-dihydroxy-2-butanone 4-phosphate synthase n=1 Tax=Pseudogemmobacter humi TaxID=2483812 RepID=A0A3P5X525_9RHOB|nr:3,4-dihydroxy-2-butanone-4-phosphate synthase [Pseudogemmobacter humi]VDC26400.1 Riboflavin biosynthesis protein RibBA [Pseudogemmobacter humi]